MSPPASLSARWRKIKKRCSFSSSDRLVRSKSFSEEVSASELEPGEVEQEDVEEMESKYLTVGAREAGRFQGLRTKIVQWNSELKKRRSSENLSERAGREVGRVKNGDDHMFVVASPSNSGFVKSALVISSVSSTTYSTQSLKPRPKPRPNTSPWSRTRISAGGDPVVDHWSSTKRPNAGGKKVENAWSPSRPGPKVREHVEDQWSSPSPSPPASDDFSDPDTSQRTHSFACQRTLYQDQDSGYDGFCPEKSIYSTGSSETSSVLSSDGQEPRDTSFREPETYGKSPARPRPSAIYEKHSDYCQELREPTPLHQSTPQTRSGRATISQATVVTLSKTGLTSGRYQDVPPPLPPRPPPPREEGSIVVPTAVPPVPQSKPRNRMIMQGAVSLPRKKTEFRDQARRRGSYHDGFTNLQQNSEGGELDNHSTELVIKADDKVSVRSKLLVDKITCIFPFRTRVQNFAPYHASARAKATASRM